MLSHSYHQNIYSFTERRWRRFLPRCKYRGSQRRVILWFRLKKAVGLLSGDRGVITLEYLIMALLIAGVAGAVVAALTSNMAGTHNTMVDIITNITGSGF